MHAIKSRLATLDFNLDSASYIVRGGESLESIAFRYNTTVASLKQLNPGAAAGVHTGMEILIRPPVGGTPSIIQQAGWQSPAAPAVKVAPARTRQAVPLQSTTLASQATDDYLLGSEANGRTVYQYPPVLAPDTSRLAQLPGYPVEEVIVDQNFQIPTPIGRGYQTLPGVAGGWQWPLKGQLARDYDPRRPNGRSVEIIGTLGDDIYATRDGVVELIARSPDTVGNVVIIRHEDNYLSIYSNMRDLFVSKNDKVKQGDPIASLGANAKDEPLLRFEISKDGNFLNPIDYLSTR